MWKKIIKALNNPRLALTVAKYKILYLLNPRLLNGGERYDPQIFRRVKLEARVHLPRYEFAGSLIDSQEEVLDIACGTGYGSDFLSRRCRQVTGVDISEAALEFAETTYGRTPNISFSKGDLLSNKLSADTVVSFETIEHVDAPPETAILKLRSVARKRLILSVPYKEKPGRNPHHRHFFLDEGTFACLKDEGELRFFYQAPDGKISNARTGPIQNILAVWTR